MAMTYPDRQSSRNIGEPNGTYTKVVLQITFKTEMLQKKLCLFGAVVELAHSISAGSYVIHPSHTHAFTSSFFIIYLRHLTFEQITMPKTELYEMALMKMCWFTAGGHPHSHIRTQHSHTHTYTPRRKETHRNHTKSKPNQKIWRSRLAHASDNH